MHIVIHWFQKDYGGVDSVIRATLLNWPNKNDYFTIVYNKENPGINVLKADNIPLTIKYVVQSSPVFIWRVKYLQHLFLWFYLLMQKISIAKIIRQLKDVEAIIVHNGTYPGSIESLASLWAAKSLGIRKRMLVIHHGAIHGNIIKRPGESLMDYFVLRYWSTDFVAVSRATRNTLIQNRYFDTNINPIRVIHNGITMSSFMEGSIDNLRQKYEINSDKILIGLVGRIERYKGHEDLLLALDELNHKKRNLFHIIFIGYGNNFEMERILKISKLLNLDGMITFTGFLDGDIKKWISQLDILAMLTKDFEGFGLTIIEAMSVNIPVIATNVGGVSEFMSQNNGMLIAPESPESIARALLDYLENKDNFLVRAEKAKKDVTKHNGKLMAYRYHRLLKI